MRKLGFLGAAAALATVAFVQTAQATDVEWNGFGSAYYTQSFSPELIPGGSDASSNFTNASNFGLNVGAKLTDNSSVAAQLVALNTDANGDWTLNAKWAFLKYNFSNSFNFKVGRQLVPALLAAEFQSVGYLMPFRVIPRAASVLVPVTGFNGVSLNYNMDGFSVMAFGGRPNYDLPRSGTTTFAGGAKDLTGLAVGYEGDGYGVRAHWSRSRTELTINSALPARGTVDTYTIGYRVDKMGFVSWGEYGFVKSDDGSQMPVTGVGQGGKFAASMRGGYVLLGYKIGDFMPRYTFAHADIEVGLPNGKTTSHIVGVNYNVNPQIVAKVEYEMVTVPPATETGAGLATRQTGSTATSGNAVFAGFDFVF